MVEPTHLKNMIVKWKSFPQFSGWKKISNQNCQFQISNIPDGKKTPHVFPTFFPPEPRCGWDHWAVRSTGSCFDLPSFPAELGDGGVFLEPPGPTWQWQQSAFQNSVVSPKEKGGEWMKHTKTWIPCHSMPQHTKSLQSWLLWKLNCLNVTTVSQGKPSAIVLHVDWGMMFVGHPAQTMRTQPLFTTRNSEYINTYCQPPCMQMETTGYHSHFSWYFSHPGTMAPTDWTLCLSASSRFSSTMRVALLGVTKTWR